MCSSNLLFFLRQRKCSRSNLPAFQKSIATELIYNWKKSKQKECELCMDLAHGQERHSVLGACRHHEYNQRSQPKTFPACDSIRSQATETKLFGRCWFVSSNTHLPFSLDTHFFSSSSGWVCKMNWSELSWDCTAGAASCTRATDKAAHI